MDDILYSRERVIWLRKIIGKSPKSYAARLIPLRFAKMGNVFRRHRYLNYSRFSSALNFSDATSLFKIAGFFATQSRRLPGNEIDLTEILLWRYNKSFSNTFRTKIPKNCTGKKGPDGEPGNTLSKSFGVENVYQLLYIATRTFGYRLPRIAGVMTGYAH